MDYSTNHPAATVARVATFSPNAATLPENVLQCIFSLNIQGPLIFPPPMGEQRRVLSQVCDNWRRIVVSTTTYWNAFDFNQCKEVQHPINLLQLAELFFCQSGNTIPLSIVFRSFQSNLCRYIFNLIARPRAHRIWFLSCRVTKSELATYFGPGHLQFPLSGLRSIDISVICNSVESTTSQRTFIGPIDLSVFQRTPDLQQASLQFLDGLQPHDLCLPPPWGRLTRLDIGQTAIRVHTFMYILEQSLRLEDGVFCVDFSQPHAGQPTTLRQISVPSLRRLRMSLVEPSQDTRMFRKLKLPALEELWVEREEFEHTTIRNTTIYEQLLTNLPSTLNHLTIAEFFIRPSAQYTPRLNRSLRFICQDMDGAFRISQYLTSLFLYPGVYMTPRVLEKIACGELLPFLEKLGVSSVSGWDVVSMVSRKNFASTLPERGPSSGSEAVTRPMALNYLHLFVIGYGLDRAQLDEAARVLCLVGGYVILHAGETRAVEYA